MSEHVEALLKRRQRAVARQAPWINLLRNAYTLSQPNRNVWQLQTAEGANKNFMVYDGTLVLALRRFVNKMQSSLMPQNVNWCQFVVADAFQKEVVEEVGEEQAKLFLDSAKVVLQKRTDVFFRYLRGSNMDPTVNESLYDMAVSTGALQFNEGPDEDPFIFASIPADKIYYCEGPWGTIDTVFRDFVDIEKRVAQQMWEGFKLPSSFHDNGDPYQCITLYECSYYDYDKKMYKTTIIEASSNGVCLDIESESWPFIIFRWYKLPGEVMGRGPVIDAFPSAATINKAFEDEILAAELMAKPIYMGYSDGLFNPYSFRVASNTIIPVNPIASGGSWPIAPLPKAGDIAFGAIVINDLRQQIDKIMFNSPLGPIEDAPPLTATEVAIRQNEMIEDAAASFSRLQREFFFPLIKRALWILKKKGLIEPFELDGKVIDVKFQTPLSLGKGQLDVNQFMLMYQHLVNISGQEAAQMFIDVPKLPRWLGENMNVELTLIKSEAEIIASIQKLKHEQEQMMIDQQQGAMNDARAA